MSDLLKQAIADAKAVRATALSNAKAALEEHFAPRLQSMLSEKLKAEVEGDEAGLDAAPAPEAHADAAQDAAMAAGGAPEGHADAAQDAAMAAGEAPAAAPAAAPALEAPAEEPAPVAEEEEELDLEGVMDEDTANEPGTSNAANPHP
jgi:hypothetical protein